VLPVVQRAGVPVIVLNLSPEAAIDYDWFNQLDDRTRSQPCRRPPTLVQNSLRYTLFLLVPCPPLVLTTDAVVNAC
jgi:hypothetical protein